MQHELQHNIHNLKISIRTAHVLHVSPLAGSVTHKMAKWLCGCREFQHPAGF